MTLRPRNRTDFDDLYAAGLVGAAEALQSYDPAKDTKMTTHARNRIRGEMLDYLRGRNRAAWLALAKQESIAADARDKFATAKSPGRIARIQRELSAAERQIERLRSRLQPPVSIDKIQTAGEGSRKMEFLACHDAEPERDWWEWALNGLSRRQKLLLKLRFLAGFTQADAARVIGLHYSRVSQIEAETLRHLRERFSGMAPVELGGTSGRE
jgi:RNA polymerase sigma factor (sigma-70 family)